jgi:hypothetical protein
LSPRTGWSSSPKTKEGKYLHRITMKKKHKVAANNILINQKIKKRRWWDKRTKRTILTYKNLS